MTAGSAARAFLPEEEPGARRDDRHESLVRFIKANEARVKRFLQRVCDDPGLAEDALQEALMVAFAKWPVVSRHDKPLLWLRKTAWHKLQDLLRSRQLEVVGLDEVEPALVADASDEWEAEHMLRQLLRRLPTRPRAVLALAADGCTDEEISAQLGLALTTVRTYKSAARRQFKELSGQAGYEAGTRRRT